LAWLSAWKVEFILTVVGDGENRAEYESLVKEKSLDRRIRWLGWLPLERLAEIYREQDVLVLPSRFEGMASVSLQALGSGCVVVSTDVFGAEDAIVSGVNGFIVPQEDDAAFAQALTALAEPATLAKMRQAALVSAPNYGWDVVADRYEELYRQALGEKLPSKAHDYA
jgi:glycosyltransferase involved in cell wall biosynthesis